MTADPQMKLVRRLIRTHSLARIDFTVTTRAAHARAFPDTFNPVVAQRRDEAIAREGSLTLKRAGEITTESMGMLCTGSGETINDALASLEVALKGLGA